MKRTVKWMNNRNANNPKKFINESLFRSVFIRDYSTIVHSTQFKRLAGKTQVFSQPKHDHVRNRLSHSIEVSHIARHLCRMFLLILKNKSIKYYEGFEQEFEDLVASACLAHDLGHPPFGHKGQKVLDKNFQKVEFDDNKQVFHFFVGEGNALVVSCSLASAVVKKYDSGSYREELELFKEVFEACGLGEKRHPASYLMEAADDLAYLASDIEDYLRLGGRTDAGIIGLIREAFDQVVSVSEALEPDGRIIDKFTEEAAMKGEFPFTVKKFSTIIIRTLMFHLNHVFMEILENVKSIEELPDAFHKYIVAKKNKKLFDEKKELNLLYSDGQYSQVSSDQILQIKDKFLNGKILKMPYIAQQDAIAEEVISFFGQMEGKIIDRDSLSNPFFRLMPREYRHEIEGLLEEPMAQGDRESKISRVLCDFISGMTDRYAVGFYSKLKNPEKLSLAS